MSHKRAVVSVRLILSVMYIAIVSPIQSQWVVDDMGCRTPRRGVGTCIPIRNCAPMVEFLQSVASSNDGVPESVVATLKEYQCGFQSNSVKVCCPKGPIIPPKMNVLSGGDPPPPDVTRHKNINLLPDDCGLSPAAERITGGTNTSLFEFPWMALISYQTRNGPAFKCAGTVIHPRYILTAAHCITNLSNLSLLGVRLGEYKISSQVDCESFPGTTQKICSPPVQDIAIEEVIPHPRYSHEESSNDIGLLRLEVPINVNVDNVKPICLPTSASLRNVNLTGTKLIVTGWGVTNTRTRTTSDELLKVLLPVVPQMDCQKAYQKSAKISFRQICAGGVNKQDSCGGDSGGPLQRIENFNSDARSVQYGIVSFGPRSCGQNGVPAVYTKVNYYLDWILDSIRP